MIVRRFEAEVRFWQLLIPCRTILTGMITAKFLTLDTATAALHATVKQYTAHSANYLVLDRQISDGLTAVSEEDVAKVSRDAMQRPVHKLIAS